MVLPQFFKYLLFVRPAVGFPVVFCIADVESLRGFSHFRGRSGYYPLGVEAILAVL